MCAAGRIRDALAENRSPARAAAKPVRRIETSLSTGLFRQGVGLKQEVARGTCRGGETAPTDTHGKSVLLVEPMVADFRDDALNDPLQVLQRAADKKNPNTTSRGRDLDEICVSDQGTDDLRELLSRAARIGAIAVSTLVNCQHGNRVLQTRSLTRLELSHAGKGFPVNDGAVGPEVPGGHSQRSIG